MRVSDYYAVWKGCEYGSGGRDRQRHMTPIFFYGEEPSEEGFERGRADPRHRWPTWSRWVPLDEIERRFKARTLGTWHGAEFSVVGQSDDGTGPVGDPNVLIEGPKKELGERKPIEWWLEFPNLELLDQGIVLGWVPWSELTDLREEVSERPFPSAGS